MVRQTQIDTTVITPDSKIEFASRFVLVPPGARVYYIGPNRRGESNILRSRVTCKVACSPNSAVRIPMAKVPKPFPQDEVWQIYFGLNTTTFYSFSTSNSCSSLNLGAEVSVVGVFIF